VHGSIATASFGARRPGRRLAILLDAGLQALDETRPSRVAFGLFALALVVYAASNPLHIDFYDHYTWQADAWLHGRFGVAYPVSTGPYVNDYFQDVMPLAAQPGYALVPFPPMPALFLLPLVAIFGLGAPASLFASVLGAVNVTLVWWLAERLTRSRRTAVAVAIFFGFGTVAWYASSLGSTWFLAHVVAMFLTVLAISVAVEADRTAVAQALNATGTQPAAAAELSEARASDDCRGRLRPYRPFLAGLLLGLATLARLTMVFGLPFLLLVGGGTLRRRAVLATVGLALPVLALVGYNMAATGEPFNPAYGYVAARELHPVPGLYHPEWSIEDPRYVPQNAVIALLWMPQVRPECGLAAFDPACGTVRPDPVGMSLLLVSPAYLLGLTVLPAIRRSRLVAGATLAALAIFLADLSHFSQGWVQFGYRFSNDFAPFLLLLVALAIARRGLSRWVVGLIALSVVVNAWGVYWGGVQGW
jgi:hypothetical protein